MNPPRIFISYSHQDEAWKNRLLAHLEVLQMQDMLSIWVDTDIGAGEDWRAKIEEAIDAASVAILLISADFLRSKFIMGDEVPRIMTRREKEGLRVFPVIIRPCPWKTVSWLHTLQARPKDARPLLEGDEHQIDADLAAIVEEVAGIIRKTDE